MLLCTGVVDLNVLTVTWNVGNRAPPTSLDALLPTEGGEHDVIVVALQECSYTVHKAAAAGGAADAAGAGAAEAGADNAAAGEAAAAGDDDDDDEGEEPAETPAAAPGAPAGSAEAPAAVPAAAPAGGEAPAVQVPAGAGAATRRPSAVARCDKRRRR